MSRWRKFRELSWPDIGFVLFSIGGLIGVGLLLPVAGFGRSLAWLRRSSAAAGSRQPSAGALDWARRRAYLVSVAARFGPYRATCLRRSLLLWWVVRRHGLDPRLCLGVRPEPESAPGNSELLAHAWIELGDEVLNDRAEIAQSYAAFDAENLPERVSWS